MAWTVKQAFAKQQVGASATSATVTLGVTPVAGNLLVAFLLWFDGTNSTAGAVTIKDANAVSFSLTASSPANARPTTAGIIYCAYLQVPATPNGAITATFATTGAGGVATLWVGEFAPTSGSSGGIDAETTGTGTTGTPITTPTITVNQSGDLVVSAALSDHQVSSVDAPWTQAAAGIGNQFSEGIGYILSQASSVAAAMTQNVSSGWASIGASFKFSAAAGATPRGGALTLMGVGN